MPMFLFQHSKRLQLKWESCYEKSENNDTYGVICQLPESQEKFLGNSLHEDPGNLVFPENMDCFQGLLVDPIIEYRYHLGENLNRKDVSCPMHVDYRRGKVPQLTHIVMVHHLVQPAVNFRQHVLQENGNRSDLERGQDAMLELGWRTGLSNTQERSRMYR